MNAMSRQPWEWVAGFLLVAKNICYAMCGPAGYLLQGKVGAGEPAAGVAGGGC